MSSDDLSHGSLTIIMTVFLFFASYRRQLFAFKNTFKSDKFEKKNVENYHKSRKDTMNKIIATHIHNMNEIFIGVCFGIALGYIVYYHHNRD